MNDEDDIAYVYICMYMDMYRNMRLKKVNECAHIRLHERKSFVQFKIILFYFILNATHRDMFQNSHFIKRRMKERKKGMNESRSE